MTHDIFLNILDDTLAELEDEPADVFDNIDHIVLSGLPTSPPFDSSGGAEVEIPYVLSTKGLDKLIPPNEDEDEYIDDETDL